MNKGAKDKELGVFINLDGRFYPAGILSMTEDGPNVVASKFAYGLKYLERPKAVGIDPVSLSIEDKDLIRGRELMPVEGLTFFGGIRDASPDGWGRRVIEARLKVPANSLAESVYLMNAGDDRTGALDIRESIGAQEHGKEKKSILRLDYLMEAADRIEQGEPVPEHLQEIFKVGSGLGGMRPKAAIEDEGGVLWLAKFPSRGEGMNVPSIESATMLLAEKAGLNVPPIKTQKIGDGTVMLIRRFDRALVNGEQHRYHMVSALTMLGCHESESINKSYWNIADVIKKYAPTELIKADQKELFGRMIFNIFVTNDDDHLRNHAFLWDAERKGWALSPLYDVMPRAMLSTERSLHLGVGGQGRLATIDNAITGYARFGITLNEAEEVIDRVWRAVRQWKQYFEEFGVSVDDVSKIESAFRHMDDIKGAT